MRSQNKPKKTKNPKNISISSQSQFLSEGFSSPSKVEFQYLFKLHNNQYFAPFTLSLFLNK